MHKKMPEQVQKTEKIQVGCKWRLKGLFDHRNCRPRKKFLSNSDNKEKDVYAAAGNPRGKSSSHSLGNNREIISNASENKSITVDDVSERHVTKQNQENSEMHKLALEILDSNSDLFLKLLNDPNSVLVKRIQNAENLQQAKKETVKLLYENQLAKCCSKAIPRMHKKPEHTIHKSILERIKSEYGCPSTNLEVPGTSNSIVVLRPRRKKHGKDTSRKHRHVELSYRSDIGTASERAKVSYINKTDMEAKMHISKMLRNAKNLEQLSAKQDPRTLKSILLSPLSSPEHEFSTVFCRRADRDDSVYSQQMRFLTCNKSQFAFKKNSLPLENKEVSKSADCVKLYDQFQYSGSEAKVLDRIHSTDDNLSSQAYVKNLEINDTIKLADSDIPEVPSKHVFVTSDERSSYTPKLCNENRYLEFSIQDFQLENSKAINFSSVVSSSNPSSEYKVETKDGCKERDEQQSQNSVLEAILTKDFTNLSSNLNHPEKPLIHPMHPDSKIDDPEASLNTAIENVIQTSGLNCEELSKKLHSSVQLLNPCSFVEHKLFSDFIKCILLELNQYNFESHPRASFIKPNTLASSILAKNEKDEFLKEIQWYLVPPVTSRTLEDLAIRDVRKSGTWTRRRLETEEVVIQLAEFMLNALIMQTIFIIQN